MWPPPRAECRGGCGVGCARLNVHVKRTVAVAGVVLLLAGCGGPAPSTGVTGRWQVAVHATYGELYTWATTAEVVEGALQVSPGDTEPMTLRRVRVPINVSPNTPVHTYTLRATATVTWPSGRQEVCRSLGDNKWGDVVLRPAADKVVETVAFACPDTGLGDPGDSTYITIS